MARSVPRITVLIVTVIVLAASTMVFGGRIYSWASDRTVAVTAPVAERIGRLRSVVTLFLTRADLAARVRQLETENERLRGQLGELDQLRHDIGFLRAAATLSLPPPQMRLAAGIFSYASLVGSRQAVVNRGTDDGVMAGDVVVTAQGSLVGVIRDVSDRHAIVRRIQDPGFEVTARVLDSDVAGLARSDGRGSMLLDLVRKDESIPEGAQLVTSGNDRFPGGLVIGTVRAVDASAPTLFQIIHVAPVIPDSVSGPVLIIRP